MKPAEPIDSEDPGDPAYNSHSYRPSSLKERTSALDPLSLHPGPVHVHCIAQILALSWIDSWPELDNHRDHEMNGRSILNRTVRFQMPGI
jgi:hypothetical protein